MPNWLRQNKTSGLGKDFTPWIVGVLVVVMIIAVGKQAFKHYQIQQEIETAELSVAELRAKNGELVDLLTYVKSPAYTEEQARLKLGLAKVGERVAVLPEGQVLGASDAGEGNMSGGQAGNTWKWWGYFFPTQP